MKFDSDRPEMGTYLKAISAVLRAPAEAGGWAWQQAIQPREQSLQLVVVDGQPVAASVRCFTACPDEEGCTVINLSVGDQDGCSAHHARFDQGKGMYCAVSIDYGPDAIAIHNVTWIEGQKSGQLVVLQADPAMGIYGNPPAWSHAA